MKRCLLMMVFLLTTSYALAASFPAMQAHRTHPSHPIINSVDTAQPDSLVYDNGNGESLNTAPNYFSGVHFTAVAEFRLRTAYFQVYNPTTSTAACSVAVFSDTVVSTTAGNRHRWNRLLSTRWTRATPPLADAEWVDLDLADSILFPTGSEFWIVIGNFVAGANYPTAANLWNCMDGNGATDYRSVIKLGSPLSGWTTTNWGCISGDLLIRAGGAYAGNIIDARVDSIWAANSAGDHRFFWPTGTPVRYSAVIKNVGSNAMMGHSIEFSVIDTTEQAPLDTIFHQTITGLPQLARNATYTATSNYDTLPTNAKNLIVTAKVNLGDDNNMANNTRYLEQNTNNLNTWYSYDNATSQSTMNYGGGQLIGAFFIPSRYPCRLDTVAIGLSNNLLNRTDSLYIVVTPSLGTAPSMSNARIVEFDVPDTADGYFKVPMDTVINIFSGGVYVGWLTAANQGLMQNTTQPVGGTNLSMPAAYMQWLSGTITAIESGDWLFSAYFSPTNALPPYPILRTNPLPGATIPFDTTSIGFTSSKPFWVYNDGGDSLTVTRLSIATAYRAQFAFSRTFPFRVAPRDSALINITWTPPATQTSLSASLTLQTNTDPPSIRYTVTATSTVSAPEETTIPHEFALKANYPNPFNPSTSIRFAVPKLSNVKITVLDVLGREVAQLVNEKYAPGNYSVNFNGEGLATGVYFYKMEAGEFSSVQKMMLLK